VACPKIKIDVFVMELSQYDCFSNFFVMTKELSFVSPLGTKIKINFLCSHNNFSLCCTKIYNETGSFDLKCIHNGH